MIPSVKLLPHENGLKQLNLWSLQDRRIRADLIEVFWKLSTDLHLLNSVPCSNSLHIIVLGAIPWIWLRNVQGWICGNTSSANELLTYGIILILWQYLHRPTDGIPCHTNPWYHPNTPRVVLVLLISYAYAKLYKDGPCNMQQFIL